MGVFFLPFLKKKNCVFILLILFFLVFAVNKTENNASAAVNPLRVFKDIDEGNGDWRYVRYLASKGAVNGYPDGNFLPHKPLSWSEALKMVICMSEINFDKRNNVSDDISLKHWAASYIREAKSRGWVKEIIPDKKISGKEAIKIILLFSNYKTKKGEISEFQIKLIDSFLNEVEREWAVRKYISRNEMARVLATADILTENTNNYFLFEIKPLKGELYFLKQNGGVFQKEEIRTKRNVSGEKEFITGSNSEAEIKLGNNCSVLLKEGTRMRISSINAVPYIDTAGLVVPEIKNFNLELEMGEIFVFFRGGELLKLDDTKAGKQFSKENKTITFVSEKISVTADEAVWQHKIGPRGDTLSVVQGEIKVLSGGREIKLRAGDCWRSFLADKCGRNFIFPKDVCRSWQNVGYWLKTQGQVEEDEKLNEVLEAVKSIAGCVKREEEAQKDLINAAITYTGEITAAGGEEIVLEALLEEEGTKKVLAGEKIIFNINSREFSAYTDEIGKASVRLSLDGWQPGAYKLSVLYPGSRIYSAVTIKKVLYVKEADSEAEIEYAGVTESYAGIPIKCTARLIYLGEPMVGERLLLSTGEQNFESVTDENGEAEWELIFKSSGSHNINIQFFKEGWETVSLTKEITVLPHLEDIFPSEAPAGATLDLYGEGLGMSGGKVYIGSMEAEIEGGVWEDKHVRVKVPAGLETGEYSVSLELVGTGRSNELTLVITSQPFISSINPESGFPASLVTISGSNFGKNLLETGGIYWDGTRAKVISWSEGSITAEVPSGLQGTEAVKVLVAGVESNSVNFSLLSPWPMYGGGYNHKNLSLYAGDFSEEAVFQELNVEGVAKFTGPALIDQRGYLILLDESGCVWEVTPEGDYRQLVETGEGGSSTVPALDKFGGLYVPSQAGNIHFYNNERELQESYLIGGELAQGLVVGPNNRLLVCSRDNSGDTYLYLFEPYGKRLLGVSWVGSGEPGVPAILGDGSIVQSAGPRLNILSEEGVLITSLSISSGNWSSPLVSLDGKTIFSTVRSSQNSEENGLYRMQFVDNNWEIKRFTGLYNEEEFTPPSLGADGTIYVGSNKGVVYAIDPDNCSPIRELQIQEEVTITAPPVIDEKGRVFLGTPDGHFFIWDVEEDQFYSFDVPQGKVFSPSITPGGRIWAIIDGKLYFLNN